MRKTSTKRARRAGSPSMRTRSRSIASVGLISPASIGLSGANASRVRSAPASGPAAGVRVPSSMRAWIAALLSKGYARKRAALIDPHKANCTVAAGQPVEGDTTYLTVVDREGNIASWIQSIAGVWGSGIMVEAWDSSCKIAAPDFSRRQTPQRAGRRKAPVSHHHPGVHGTRRSAHRIRHHERTRTSRSRMPSSPPTSSIME